MPARAWQAIIHAALKSEKLPDPLFKLKNQPEVFSTYSGVRCQVGLADGWIEPVKEGMMHIFLNGKRVSGQRANQILAAKL